MAKISIKVQELLWACEQLLHWMDDYEDVGNEEVPEEIRIRARAAIAKFRKS